VNKDEEWEIRKQSVAIKKWREKIFQTRDEKWKSQPPQQQPNNQKYKSKVRRKERKIFSVAVCILSISVFEMCEGFYYSEHLFHLVSVFHSTMKRERTRHNSEKKEEKEISSNFSGFAHRHIHLHPHMRDVS
jgi:hypothetical protein